MKSLPQFVDAARIKLIKDSHQTALVLLWLFFLCLLAYGLLLPTLGFYWDDLPILFLFKIRGAGGFPAFLASDRPFSAWIFMLTTSLFRFNPLGYHLVAFLLRVFSVFLFHRIFLRIWPDRRKLAAVSSSIFALYPGFLQQPIALIYCHHLSVLCFYLLSILLMLENACSERFDWLKGALAWLTTLHMFSIENFAMLELIRPVLLWIILKQRFQENRTTIKKVLSLWLPHLLIFLAFLLWRVFILKFPTYEPDLLDGYQSNPASTLLNLLGRVPTDFLTVTAGAWAHTFTFPGMSAFGINATRLFWAILFSSAGVSFFVMLLLPRDTPEDRAGRNTWLELLVPGLLLFLLAGSIVWVLELPLEIEFAWDRMTLAFIPAVALLAAALFFAIDRLLIGWPKNVFPNLLFALLIGTAAGGHFRNTMEYKRDWEDLQSFFWQMAWRIPNLESGTAVMTSSLGLDYYSDNSLTAPLNLMYAPENRENDLPYVFYFSEVRAREWLEEGDFSHPIRQRYRSFVFEGSSGQMIAIKYDPPGCMQVMDRLYANSVTLPNLTERQVKEIKFSQLSLIGDAPVHMPLKEIFNNEPAPGWCTYFEKADLARQMGAYSQAAALGDEAIQLGFSPRAASEWLPFLESYVRDGDWNKARFIADQMQAAEGNYINGFCATLKRLSRDEQIQDKASLSQIKGYMRDYNCP